MHATRLRRVGGSVMLAVPPALLDLLQLKAGAEVGLSTEGGRLIVGPLVRPRYRLETLLAECEAAPESMGTDAEWLEGGPVGRELL